VAVGESDVETSLHCDGHVVTERPTGLSVVVEGAAAAGHKTAASAMWLQVTSLSCLFGSKHMYAKAAHGNTPQCSSRHVWLHSTQSLAVCSADALQLGIPQPGNYQHSRAHSLYFSPVQMRWAACSSLTTYPISTSRHSRRVCGCVAYRTADAEKDYFLGWT
jgi:hypothetical protein